MAIYIKVDKKGSEEVIKDCKVKTFGCVAALSTSVVVTDLAKGKTIEEALKLKKDDVVKVLGGLPPIKIHCSLLAIDALKMAIYDYLKKNKRPIPKELEELREKEDSVLGHIHERECGIGKV